MNADNSRVTRRGSTGKITLALGASVALLALANVANAQPAPTEPAVAPASATTPTEPAAAPAGAPAPTATPTAATPPAPAPTPATAPAPATATPTPPPASAGQSEYTGPPLVLGSQKKQDFGGYGGVTVAYSHMLHHDGVLVGAEGALLVEHRLSIGAGGYGFSRSPSGPAAADGTPREYYTGYGGFIFRYAVYTNIPVYASFGVMIGGGALTLAPNYHDNADHHDDESAVVRGFFITQPDLALHVNMTRWLRFSILGGYRFASGTEDFDYESDSLSGAVVGGNVQAGWF